LCRGLLHIFGELFQYLFNACGDGKCFDFNAKNIEKYYRAGSGKTVTVDVSEIDSLLNLPGVTWTQNPKAPNEYLVSTLGRDGASSASQGRVIGDFTAVKQPDGSFAFKRDYYNFEQHSNPENNVRTGTRNLITDLASQHVGPGKSFFIEFTGTWRPRFPPMPTAP
jgi:hypothetical protein